MQTLTQTITSPSGPMGIHVVRPDGDGPFPVVVFFHHGPGLDDGSKEAMARIAPWGYYVVTHDRYHRAEAWYRMKSRADDEIKNMFGRCSAPPRRRWQRTSAPSWTGSPRIRPPVTEPWPVSAIASARVRCCARFGTR